MSVKISHYLCTTLCAILVASALISDVKAKSYGSHHRSSHVSHAHTKPYSKPSQTHHSYPTSTSFSGSSHSSVNSQSHGYPGTSHLSGNSGSAAVVQHNYPQSHSNPTSHLSGTGQSSHSYPAAHQNSLSGGGSGSSVHRYPSTNTLSGSGARPQYNTHQSWNSHQPTHTVHHHTVHHHNYVYRPPTVIHYSTSFGGNPVSYPIYTGAPPSYVYEYRGSGNRYSNLLAGLALYNLGRISAAPRANNYHQHYIPRSDEYCQFGVRYRTGAVEEMNIDCRAITYFIFETAEAAPQLQPQTQTYVSTNTVNQATSTTQIMLPNGTLMMPANTQTQVNTVNGVMIPNTQQILSPNGQVVSNTQQFNTVTTTTTQALSVTDTRLLGKPVHVNDNMECYVKRITSFSNMQKPVPCGLLQEYSASSLRGSAVITKSSMTVIVIAIAFLLY